MRMQVHFQANQTHFRMKGFARGLVLKQSLTATLKWPIDNDYATFSYIHGQNSNTISWPTNRLCLQHPSPPQQNVDVDLSKQGPIVQHYGV